MTHSDPDALAMMAMDESDLSEADIRHIESCDQCLTEMRSLHRVADLARSGRPDESFDAPSPEVWTRISATLELDPTLRPAGHPAGSAAPDRQAAAPDAPPAVARRHRAPRRRGRTGRIARLVRVVASLAVIAAVAAVITTVVVLQRDRPVVIAEARLAPPSGGASAAAAAVIEQQRNGVRDIRIDIDDADAATPGDSYREVWLISTDLTRLVSLGTLDGAEGRFVIPESVDLAEFPIVDISVEPVDGDPQHSGDTIVRGTLDS